MAEKFLVLSTQEDKETRRAVTYLAGEKGVKVDREGIKAAVGVLIARIRDGMKLVGMATRYGTIETTAAGKTVPSGALARRYRFAQYLSVSDTPETQEIHEKLSDGYGMTSSDAAKLCQAVKPELVKLGLVTGQGNKEQDESKRAAQAAHRAAARILGWESDGIKATAGATKGIRRFNGRTLVKLALDGATVDVLASQVVFLDADAPSTPKVVRTTPRKPKAKAA